MTVLKISQQTLIQLPAGASGAAVEISYNGTTTGSVVASGYDKGRAVIVDGRLAKLTGLDKVSPLQVVGREAGGRMPARVTLRIYPEGSGVVSPITITGLPVGSPDVPGVWDLSNIDDASGGLDVVLPGERQRLAVLMEGAGTARIAAEAAAQSAGTAKAQADAAVANLNNQVEGAAAQAAAGTVARVNDKLADIAQTRSQLSQQQQANNDATAQAVQQATTVSLMRGTVQTEAQAKSGADGSYLVSDTMQVVRVQAGQIVARGPDIPTTATSVARVADIQALRGYAGLAMSISVDDPVRGGTFVRRLAGQKINNGTRFAHSNPAYLWERLGVGHTLYVDWFIDPDFQHAPQIQAAIDETPVNGTLIGGRKKVGDWAGYYVLQSWNRPDGRTDVCLTIDKPINLHWDSNEFAGALTTDELPTTMRPIEVTARGVPYGGAKKGYRLRGLGIMPLNYAKICGKGALYLEAAAHQNMADIEIQGGQFVYNGRLNDVDDTAAVLVYNSGEDGIFGMRVKGAMIHGGFRAVKWGDSCSITDYCQFTGHGRMIDISMLTPSDPMNASSCLLIADCNFNTQGTILRLQDSCLFTLRNFNGETRNISEGQQMPSQPAIEIINCGTVAGIGGLSARAWSGSVITAMKILPAVGGTRQLTSNQGGIRLVNCRNITLQGGSYGAQGIIGSDNTVVGRGVAIDVVDSEYIIIDYPDLQLGPDADGVIINAGSKNCVVRGVTENPGTNRGTRKIVDNGCGTMGVVRRLTPAAAWADWDGETGLRYVKREDGVVQLFGSVKPAGGVRAVETFTPLGIMPTGFMPGPYNSVRRGGNVVERGEYYSGNAPRTKIEAVIISVDHTNTDNPGILRFNPLSNGFDEMIPDVHRLDVDMSFYAPPVS